MMDFSCQRVASHRTNNRASALRETLLSPTCHFAPLFQVWLFTGLATGLYHQSGSPARWVDWGKHDHLFLNLLRRPQHSRKRSGERKGRTRCSPQLWVAVGRCGAVAFPLCTTTFEGSLATTCGVSPGAVWVEAMSGAHTHSATQHDPLSNYIQQGFGCTPTGPQRTWVGIFGVVLLHHWYLFMCVPSEACRTSVKSQRALHLT